MNQTKDRTGIIPGELATSASERRIATLALGMVQAMRHHRMTIDEAWDELFNVKVYAKLRNRHCDRRLLKMFSWALELPNVEPLGEEALAESYDAIEALAESVLKATAGSRRPSLRLPRTAKTIVKRLRLIGQGRRKLRATP
jgi:hypothetical protein